MQPIVQRGGRLLLMIEARCAGPSSVGNCRAGTSSVGGAGTSSIGKIDGTSSELEIDESSSMVNFGYSLVDAIRDVIGGSLTKKADVLSVVECVMIL
jgi:hypothetical protein